MAVVLGIRPPICLLVGVIIIFFYSFWRGGGGGGGADVHLYYLGLEGGG